MRGAPSEGGDPAATSEPLGGCLKFLKKACSCQRARQSRAQCRASEGVMGLFMASFSNLPQEYVMRGMARPPLRRLV